MRRKLWTDLIQNTRNALCIIIISPQYSVGETGRYGAPGRREIGHGALGERALAPSSP